MLHSIRDVVGAQEKVVKSVNDLTQALFYVSFFLHIDTACTIIFAPSMDNSDAPSCPPVFQLKVLLQERGVFPVSLLFPLAYFRDASLFVFNIY